MSGFGGDDEPTTYLRYGDDGGTPAEYPRSMPQLSTSPFYLPNLIAAIVASIGVVVGSVAPWAGLNATSVGGLDVHPWGLITLILGAATSIALFVQLNLGRTSFSLRWAVPLCWAVLVAAVACLAIAVVRIVTVKSVGEDADGVVLILVGWGLWLIAICSAIVTVTAAIVATQIGKAAEAQSGVANDTWASTWRWAAIVGSAAILVVALFNGYKPTRVSIQAGESATATRTVTAAPSTITAAAPGTRNPRATIPANATPCTPAFSDAELSTSATGTDATSCPFAEAVRYQYLSRAARDATVTLNVVSPVTHQSYTMTCSGDQVVRCWGGNNAVVYLY